jgi:hypothetical protein
VAPAPASRTGERVVAPDAFRRATAPAPGAPAAASRSPAPPPADQPRPAHRFLTRTTLDRPVVADRPVSEGREHARPGPDRPAPERERARPPAAVFGTPGAAAPVPPQPGPAPVPAQSEPAADPATPVIEVTIGRIEVTARPSAAPRPAPLTRPASTHPSLEEYLAERSRR